MSETRGSDVRRQIPLFDESRIRPSCSTRPAPLVRNNDPLSSHIAAEEVTLSGRRDSQKRGIAAWLRSHTAHSDHNQDRYRAIT